MSVVYVSLVRFAAPLFACYVPSELKMVVAIISSCAIFSLLQWIEIPYDSQMTRTKNRVLVRGKIR